MGPETNRRPEVFAARPIVLRGQLRCFCVHVWYMSRYLLLFVPLLVVSWASEATPISPAIESVRKSEDSQRLHRLFHDYFEEVLRLFPVYATFVGDHRYDDRIGDVKSEEHRQRRRRFYAHYLDELSKLDRELLGEQDRLSYDLFKRRLTAGLKGLEFNGHLIPVRHLRSFPARFPLLGSGRGVHPFKTVKDYDNFLKRVAAFQIRVDTAVANMRRGIELGIVQPKVVMKKTLPLLEAMIVSDVKESLFYQPILNMPATFGDADTARLTRAYTQAIEQQIIPTYKRLHAFIKDIYMPHCRRSVGISDLPGGSAWYAHLVEMHTTTDLTPDEIFQIGIKEVKRIEEKMEELRENSGFSGSLADFARHLAKNTRGYATKEELIKAYKQLRAKVTPELPGLFGRLPKAPYEIRAVEEFRESSSSSRYRSATPDGSRPGIFYVNTASVKKGPVRLSESLFLHEAMPGHHLQISLQREQVALPRFRRFGRYTAFIEGWALYAESLGPQLGLYVDPYQYFRRLRGEMWRARRLVVDIGLHHKGWTRDRAVKFMMENPGTTESRAGREVDRYIALPGQALTYKIGQLRISAIRAKAERALGSRFDVKAFHDELLKDGALPLSILETKMDAWISSQRPAP